MTEEIRCFICDRIIESDEESVEIEDGHVCLGCAGEEPDALDTRSCAPDLNFCMDAEEGVGFTATDEDI